jgi:membrane-associated phospholipid phosphatase
LRTASALETRLLLAAVLCALATLVLGALVAQRTPTRLDVEAGALRGGGVPLALFFTGLGRWPVLLGLAVGAGAVAAVLRTGLVAVAILFAAQVLSQGANAAVKLLFHRARPDAWLLIHENDLSYPSGHGVTSLVFFLGFALLAWHAPLPRPVALATVAGCAVCVAGIPWSRLALSAHYATDVLGGLLFGAAWLCAALAVILRVGAARGA